MFVVPTLEMGSNLVQSCNNIQAGISITRLAGGCGWGLVESVRLPTKATVPYTSVSLSLALTT